MANVDFISTKLLVHYLLNSYLFLLLLTGFKEVRKSVAYVLKAPLTSVLIRISLSSILANGSLLPITNKLEYEYQNRTQKK